MRSSATSFVFVLIAGLTTGGVASAQQAPPTDTTVSTGSAPTGALDVPAPDRTVSPINRPLMITGVLLLGGTYGASVIDAATSGRDADKNNLNYPVVGPWMDYANRGGCPASGSCASEVGNKTLLILDGVGQGLGALGMVASLFLPEKSTRNWFLIGNSDFHAAPASVGTGYGIGAGGTF